MQKVARFDIQDMLPLGLTLVVTGIAVAYGLNVMGDTKIDIAKADCADRTDGFSTYNETSGLCTNTTSQSASYTAEYNATGDAVTGISKLPEKLPLIVNVIVAAIIIGILIRYLMVRFG